MKNAITLTLVSRISLFRNPKFARIMKFYYSCDITKSKFYITFNLIFKNLFNTSLDSFPCIIVAFCQ